MTEEEWKEKWHWYQRRVKALERLLAHYRVSTRPPESLLRELELTRRYITVNGEWKIG